MFPNFENSRFVNSHYQAIVISGTITISSRLFIITFQVNVLQETIYKNIFPINNVFTKSIN